MDNFASEDCTWIALLLKKEIMKRIPSDLRKNFSRRDPITKEQVPNKFDISVINYYYNLTGIKLKILSLSERRLRDDKE